VQVIDQRIDERWPEQTRAHSLVDLVAVGEGEMTALEPSDLLRQGSLEGAARPGLSEIAGLVWQRGDKVVRNAPRTFTPMDGLPLLDCDLVPIERHILVAAESRSSGGSQAVWLDRASTHPARLLRVHARGRADQVAARRRALAPH